MPANMIQFPLTMKDFDRFFVGFGDQLDRMSKLHNDLTKSTQNYPPYNIRKVNDNRYMIEIAVAGFSKSEIEITLEEDRLIVKGAANQTSETTNDYLFKGIGLRDFTRTFALSDQVEVKSADMFNGMLRITVDRIIPEHKKSRKIHIQDMSGLAEVTQPLTPQLLQEKL